MPTLFQPLTVIVLYVLIHAGDIAISMGRDRDILRTILYGAVAILALISAIFLLIIH